MKKKLHRQWTLFIAPFCHVDIGYSNTQDDVLKLHKLNLDGKTNRRGERVGVLDLMEQTQDYPDGARFKFTSECSWPVYEFLNDAEIPDARKELLIERMRHGDMETGAFLISHTNRFMGPEMMLRSTSFACETLKERYGISITSAMLNDVGDASGIVPALSSSGVKYFLYGPNSLHYELPPLFYLKKPSGGDEKILAWLPPGLYGYGENTDHGLRPPPPALPFYPHNPDAPLPDYETKIFKLLHWLENNGTPLEGARKKKNWQGIHFDYCYDAYLIPYYPAHAGDNGHQDKTPSDIAKRWNETHDNPIMKIATLSEFYCYVEEKFPAHIPERRLDFTGFWGEQMFFPMSLIDAKKIPQTRRFERDIIPLERFYLSLERVSVNLPPFRDTIQESFKKAILLTDHNPCPVPISGNKHPNNSSGISYAPEDVETWKKTKEAWLDEMRVTTETASRSILNTLAENIAFENDGMRLLVLNPLSWSRNDPVFVNAELPFANFKIIQEGSGEILPHQILEDETRENTRHVHIAIQPKSVPPRGYAVFKILPVSERDTPPVESLTLREAKNIMHLENAFYALSLQKKSSAQGNVFSLQITDKQNGFTLFHTESDENFLIPVFLSRRETFGSGVLLSLPRFLLKKNAVRNMKISRMLNGPVCAIIEFEADCDKNFNTPRFLSLARKLFTKLLSENNAPAPSLPEMAKITLVLYHKTKRIDFHMRLSPLPSQLYEIALPLSFHECPNSLELENGNQTLDILKNHEAKAVPLKKTAMSAYNFPFLWIQDYPPENTFWNYARLRFKENDVYYASRESGILLFEDKNKLKNSERSGIYHLVLGPTYFGDLILGNDKSLKDYALASMLTSSMGTPEISGRACLEYQHPYFTRVFHANENTNGTLPVSHSFSELKTNDIHKGDL